MLIATLAVVLMASGFQNASDHKVLFEKAKFAMETKGDLQGAIRIFQEIIAKYPQEKEYGARAQLYVGLCFEKLGNAEAIKAYELVLKKYADRPEEVAIARERLASLRQGSPSDISVVRLSPQAELLYYKRISPDGTKIVGLDSSKGMNIAVYDLATQSQTLLTDFPWNDLEAFSPVWSRDGREIAYNRIRVDGKGIWWELVVTALNGKERMLFRSEGQQFVWPLDWLPDGSALVAILADKMGLIPSSGGSFKPISSLERILPENVSLPLVTEFISAPLVSPDGRFIAFQKRSKEGPFDIFISGIDGQPLEALTNHPADDVRPLWSPDGKYIAFQSRRQGDWALWGVAVKDGKSQGQPFMIKDGTQNSVFLNWTSQGLFQQILAQMYDIYTMPVDPETGEPAGKPRQLSFAPTGANRWPLWSPDGRFLAFVSGHQSGLMNLPQGRIILMPREGGKAKDFPIPIDIYNPKEIGAIRWLSDSSGLRFFYPDFKGEYFAYQLTVGTGEWKTEPRPRRRIHLDKSGQAFYYSKSDAKENDPGIIEENIETGAKRLVYRPEMEKGWAAYRQLRISSDYRWLAFHEEITPGDSRLVILDLETGKSCKVKVTGRLYNAFWFPNKKLIMATNAYTEYHDRSAKEGGPFYVLVAPLVGSQKKISLADSLPRSNIVSIDWSPDGKEIVFEVAAVHTSNFFLRNVIPKGHN